MSEHDVDSAAAEFETGLHSRTSLRPHHSVALMRRARLAGVVMDDHEVGPQRRARLQGLFLMLASGVVSMLILYGLLSLVRDAV